MIKVVSFSQVAWTGEVSSEYPNAYTCPCLDMLLNEGWKINDWKMSISHHYCFLDFYFRKRMKVFMNKNYRTHIIAIAQVICIWALLGLIWYLL